MSDIKWSKYAAGDYRAAVNGREIRVYREEYCSWMGSVVWTIVYRTLGSTGNWCNPSQPFCSKKRAVAALEAGEYRGVTA